MSDKITSSDHEKESHGNELKNSRKAMSKSQRFAHDTTTFASVLTNTEREPQDVPERVSEDVAQEAVRRCEKVVKGLRASSPSNCSSEDTLAPYELEELDLGKLLGSGEFSSVYEITSFSPSQCSEHGTRETKARNFLAKHARREETNDARYAIKHLRSILLADKTKFLVGAQDLAMEAQLLQSIQHPHIIKLRGVASSGWSGYATGHHTGYFLILDRLNDTLQFRTCAWAQKKRKYERDIRYLGRRRAKLASLMDTRLKVAYDIAGALAYLHKKSIIYRDLKPENLGFDIRGDIKLFDFGLAKELPLDRENENQCFRLSGAGSLRYMAPEVVLVQPYNLKVDVYSFSVLLWEILALQVPYGSYTPSMHLDGVVREGERPFVSKKWPRSIQNMLTIGWSPDPSVRPSMNTFYGALRKEVANGGNEMALDHVRRRSTHIMTPLNSEESGFFKRR